MLVPTPLEPSRIHPLVLFKREDLLPTGSHKDRAAARQISVALAAGSRAVVISSSGNAGIATAHAAALDNVPAFVFVHPATDPAKLEAIGGALTTTVVSPRAINGAKHVARELGLPNLRPSTNDEALVGYRDLAGELVAEAESFDAVVLFATSGATALAVAEGFATAAPGVAVHFVQGEGNAALADPAVAVTDETAHVAAAGRLGVRRSRRGPAMLAAVEATGGRGHVASAVDVAQARALLASDAIEVSDESAANLAVALRLADEGLRVACLISGSPPPPVDVPARLVQVADERQALEVLRKLVSELPPGTS